MDNEDEKKMRIKRYDLPIEYKSKIKKNYKHKNI